MKPSQMFPLLNEVHFWTIKNGTCIRDTDFGALKYYDKKGSSDSLLLAGKKSYIEKRGVVWSPSNKRPIKLKDSLKELEEQLSHNKVLYLQWKDSCSLQLVLNTGLLINIFVNSSTGDIQEIVFDKYMNGKLLSDYVSDAVITNSHALFTYADNQVTMVYFVKPALKNACAKKWSNLDAKVQVVELAGPTGRRLGRKLSINSNMNMVLVWWKCGRDEVYPWSPVVRDQDRANVHVYSINGTKLELICYYRTEYDPIMVTFSQHQPNVIHSIQQKISRKGEVTLEWSIFEITCGRLQNSSIISFLLPTHSCAISISPKEKKILIACIDGSLLLTDSSNSVTNISKAAFIPSIVSWHCDGCVIVTANEMGQLQFFDLTLTCVKAQLISEDVTPSSLLDLGAYFKHQPTLLQICWNRKRDIGVESAPQYDGLLLLHFERGPLAVVKLLGGGGCTKDLQYSGLTADVLVSQYLSVNNIDRAIKLLLTLNWDHDGDIVLSSLQSIMNYLLRLPLNPEREAYLEKALGSYHASKCPISRASQVEFSDPVHDLSRKFFHHLLRYQVFEKAFRLAIDLGDYDLFMDIHNYCKRIGNTEMAIAALEKAEQLSDYSSSRSDSSSCECSDSSCSCCSESSCSSREAHHKKSLPPLPVIYRSSQQPAHRHKVKFSNTVTQITVPIQEEQLLPIEEEISMNTVGLPSTEEFNTHHFHGSVNAGASTSKVPDPVPCLPNRNIRAYDEEEAGKIKVVHFGLV